MTHGNGHVSAAPSNPLKEVVAGGYCVGCGICHAASDARIPIVLDPHGCFQADHAAIANLSADVAARAATACPFADGGSNEDRIGRARYGENSAWDVRLGFYLDLCVGSVAEGDYRAKGASGGIITWILAELLRQGRIDAAIHVRKVNHPADGILFRYGVSRSVEEIQSGAKSRYYPIEASEVLRQLKEQPGRYVFVGLPCFVKAVRRLAEQDPVVNERLAFCIGLVCGHLKSTAYADCFAWQAGIPPGKLEEVDFRVKLPNRVSSDYGVRVRGAGIDATRPARQLLGAYWGYNFFRYPACDYCDDVFAETADLSVGDAWLPEFERDSRGTNVIVVRHPELRELMEMAGREERLDLTPATPDQLAASQRGGLRDRREGLAYRLYLKRERRVWAPSKRVEPSRQLERGRRRLYKLRSATGAASHGCWQKAVRRQDFDWFASRMRSHIRKIQESNMSLFQRVTERLRAALRRLLGRS